MFPSSVHMVLCVCWDIYLIQVEFVLVLNVSEGGV